ncbi:hypothetical protein L0B70_00245 [Kaistella sp. 97-N-M2]|nr:hypothetical protein L0B70_00245 [Kaistella sp. 97-N-M2]
MKKVALFAVLIGGLAFGQSKKVVASDAGGATKSQKPKLLRTTERLT